MSTGNGNGTNRILTLDQATSQRNAKDDQGRLLRHNATILDAHQIAVEEGNKVHEFYMNQIPPFVARMIQDALVSYGVVTLTAPLAEGEQPKVTTVNAEPEAIAAEDAAPATDGAEPAPFDGQGTA